MQGRSNGVTTILGLDPGSRLLGYGILQGGRGRWRRLTSGVIRLDAKKPLPERLVTIFESIRELVSIHQPDHVAIEDCFVAKSGRTALVLGQVRGVLIVAGQWERAQIHEFAPRSVKLSTVGNGGASKEQVQSMIPRLMEQCPPKLQADEADALAVAWCCSSQLHSTITIASQRVAR